MEPVGAIGTSSGGHLAVLAAIKPHDTRYANLPLDGGSAFDAEVACVVTMWPVMGSGTSAAKLSIPICICGLLYLLCLC